jgi:hypothetical protein
MANEEHLEILKKGWESWNQWREDNSEIIPDLFEANLGGTNLRGFNLASANLSGAYFREARLGVYLKDANLSKANLEKVDLTDTNLSMADLGDANLDGADLTGANLRGANLRGASFEEANLNRADLSGADLSGALFIGANLSEVNLRDANLLHSMFLATTFADIDLSEVKGLEMTEHWGPSFIGIDTIYKSHGKIPEVFLRGAGVPEKFIKYIPSLVTGEAIQLYSCFISYSTKDREFAERLHADLQSKGVRCWFAPENIKGGRKLHEQIPEAIRLYDKLLLVLSENSMESEWVKTEIYHARQDEIHNNKRKLFPIGLVDFNTIRDWQAFDADTGKDMGREIREYYIPDFSNWKDHDEYKKAFERLMRDLETEELPKP